MPRASQLALWIAFGIAGSRAFAGDPGPTQTTSTDGHAYHSPLPINDPFPDAYYGADHAGSALALASPFTSQFGQIDHAHGRFVYTVAPFTPRGSEGVFGMDVWLEQQDSSGNWNRADLNGGVSDQGVIYQPINTPNPGPSPSYTFTWTFYGAPLPPNTNFRAFVYVYIYNQGGSSQGDFPIFSATAAIPTGAANDAPRISWTSSSGALNPTQALANQAYTISADGQDDNGNLATVSINKNGQPFAYAGGGNGYGGNSQNPTSDPAGAVTYTAWATDSDGARSPPITWTVSVVGKLNQTPVSSANATLPFYSQPFTPNYFGGSGSGSWQFCVANYTSWTIAADANAGTELSPGNIWSPSWMPPAPGTYYFWVAKDGDGSYSPSAPAGLYALTVTPSPPVGNFDGLVSSAVPQGQTLSGSGWAADPEMGAPVSSVQILIDQGTTASLQAALGGSRADVQQANLAWGHWSPLDVTNSGWSFDYSTSALSLGAHTVTAIVYDSDGLSATLAPKSFTVAAPLVPPTAAISVEPASGAAPLATTISWTTTNAASVAVNGTGISSASPSGSASLTLPAPGTFVYTVAASGPGGQTSQSATVTVSVPQYILSTFASGNGSVTPGGTYPAGTTITISATPGTAAYFNGWTGGILSSDNPLSVTMNGNLILYANFAPLQAQTIVFSPPSGAAFPAAPIGLTATASSGLPVSFTIVSGPGLLDGNQLTLTGVGPVIVQAVQGGNNQWLAAAPVEGIIAVSAPFSIRRIRFNATGRDSQVTSGNSAAGAPMIWTDPAGLQNSPWPSFANPQPAVSSAGSFPLPVVPSATSGAPN